MKNSLPMKHATARFFLLSLVFWASACQSPSSPAQEEPLPEVYLLVLGIAQDAGFPQADCQKDCCRAAWADGELRRGVVCLGLVDRPAGKAYLFEATPDFKDQLRRLQTHAGTATHPLDGIFLTHAHMGHYTGLLHLGFEAMNARSVPVYVLPRMKRYLETNGPWSQLVAFQNVALHELRADSSLQLSERLRVTPFRVPHRDEFSETAGFRIEGPNRSALFIPDIDKWEKWERDIRRLVQENDYAFLDGTFFANGEIPNRDMSQIPHPFVEESLLRFQDLPPEVKRGIHFIHFNHTNPLLQPDSPESRQLREQGYPLVQEGQVFGL